MTDAIPIIPEASNQAAAPSASTSDIPKMNVDLDSRVGRMEGWLNKFSQNDYSNECLARIRTDVDCSANGNASRK